MIIPDEKMPITETGLSAEAILNPLGILNRLNLAQIIEQHITFMTERLIERLKGMDSLYEMEELFFGFMKMINKKQYDYLDMSYIIMNRVQKREFFNEIIEKGIYIHQTPFFGNTTMEDFKEIYEKFPELVEKYKFKGIERPMVMGDMYFIRLIIIAFFLLIAGNPLELRLLK